MPVGGEWELLPASPLASQGRAPVQMALFEEGALDSHSSGQ